jgi:hypothetical protein
MTAIMLNTLSARAAVEDCMDVGLVPLLKGSPGTGKSSIMKDIAKARNLKLIDIRLAQIDDVELNGFPDLDGPKATYKQFDIFPTQGDALPEGYDGWLLFFDELTSADKTKQGAAYKIILDRMVGQELLHEKALCVAAGNLASDKAVVSNMSTAMQSRLIHLNMGVDKDKWVDWAIKSGIDNRVISFIEYQPGKLHDFDPNHNDDTFACQRTWEFASRLIKGIPTIPASKLAVLSGTISQGVAREFLAFCQLSNKLVSFEDILKDPENAEMPTDPGSLYATVGMLSDYIKKENAPTVMTYIKRMPPEYQLCTIRRVYQTQPEIVFVTEVREWLTANAKEWLN